MSLNFCLVPLPLISNLHPKKAYLVYIYIYFKVRLKQESSHLDSFSFLVLYKNQEDGVIIDVAQRLKPEKVSHEETTEAKEESNDHEQYQTHQSPLHIEPDES